MNTKENMNKQIDRANTFMNMHKNNEIIMLPNAWNGGSARIFEKQGFKAIGTTSAGLAYSMGYSDGENITFEDIIRVSEEMHRVTSIPISVDIERGFASSLEDLRSNVVRILKTGAVGINIEDGNPDLKTVDDIDIFLQKIKTCFDIKRSMGLNYVINARLDSVLLQVDTPENRLGNVVVRAQRVLGAGADCVFIPGALSKEDIMYLRNNINGALNIFVHNAFNDVQFLNEIGVDRLSSGSAIVRGSYDKIMCISEAFFNENTTSMLEHGLDYNKANTFFK